MPCSQNSGENYFAKLLKECSWKNIDMYINKIMESKGEYRYDILVTALLKYSSHVVQLIHLQATSFLVCLEIWAATTTIDLRSFPHLRKKPWTL